jgi:autotransporter-associated beta strand protein
MSGSSKISLNTGNYGIQFGTNVSDPANTTTIEMNDDAKIAGYSFPASNTNNVFRLGYNGYGTMVMNDRSILDVNRIYMATTGASYAKIELNDEATITTHSTSQVGFGGTGHGEIIISGLPRVALNSGGRLDVGVTGTGSYGKIDVSGTGVKVVGTQMRVGYGESNIGIFTLNAGTEGTFTRVRAGEFGGLNGSGTITVNDAKLTTTQYLEIGYNWDNFPTEQGTNTLEVNGASSVVTCTKSSTSTWGLGIGIEGGKGTVTLNAGLITSPVDTVIVGQCDIRDTANWSTGYATINLNGGVISAPGFLTDAAAPTPTEHDAAVGVINFNGGTVKALASNPAFIAIDDATKGSLTLNVQKNATTGLGAVIDTDTFNIGFALPLQHDSTVGAIDGGLKKLGTGTLTLTGAIGYTGPTVVDSGVLQIANGLTSNLTTVSGNGSMHVADGSTLNATSIVLDTLTIGGPATAASASMTAVPEPGTFVLLALAGIGAVLAWRRK